jgi:hypothetical protein
MKKTSLFVITLLLLIATGCSKNVNKSNTNTEAANLNANKTNVNQTVTSDFNIVFRYGVGAKNELNTVDKTYTKDMVTSPSVTVPFELTSDEMNDIRQRIDEDQLFDSNISNINNGPAMMVSPCQSYYLQVIDKDIKIETNWDNCEGLMTAQEKDFSDFIINIIENHPEYKKLPLATGGYL